MEGKGYARDEEGFWIDAEGERVEIAIYVPQWLRSYGPPLTQQLRDAGFDANFDTSPGLTSLVQTGEQKASLGCKGPSGVRGMDPYLMLSYYTSQYYRPTGQPAPLWSTISRWRNEEFDRLVERTAPLQVGDEELERLFTEAMEIWVREMPDIFLAQLIIRYPCNTTPLDRLAELAGSLRLPALVAVGAAEDVHPPGAGGRGVIDPLVSFARVGCTFGPKSYGITKDDMNLAVSFNLVATTDVAEPSRLSEGKMIRGILGSLHAMPCPAAVCLAVQVNIRRQRLPDHLNRFGNPVSGDRDLHTCSTTRRFAQSDPDRLQSEEYRYETARMQMIAAKQFPYPIPAEKLSLDDPRENPAVPDAAAEEDAPPALTDADEEKLS